MKTPWHLEFWLICGIGTIHCILGAQTLETVSMLPEEVLEAVRNAANASEIRQVINNTRRIIMGSEAAQTRPYMVYLKLPSNSAKFQDYRSWLCGGIIVHEEYILTSAACIEDVKHFYVVSGTYKFGFGQDRYNNLCIKNGAKKAVWKCIPRNYVFDGHENDNIRWMNNDIAVVKLEDEFDFTRRVRGCDYAPRPICYNNQSTKFEEEGQPASIAGWGSTDKYNDWVNSRKQGANDQTDLLQAPVTILNKQACKKRWGSRYHNIIDNYMICTNDFTSGLSEICQEKYVDCVDIMEDSAERRSGSLDPETIPVHSSNHNYSSRRQKAEKDGGFCENDHGGPLVYGSGISAIAIGIISACLVKEKTNQCYGPFLYTSIYKNRQLINCAIYKDVGNDCSKLFRSSDTHTEVELSWSDHPDGPAKSEVKAMRRKEEEEKRKLAASGGMANDTIIKSNHTKHKADTPLERVGLILRSRDDDDTSVKSKDSEHKVDTPLERVGLILRSRDDDGETPKPRVEETTTTKIAAATTTAP